MRNENMLSFFFFICSYDQCNCVNPLQWNARSILLPGSNDVILAPLCNISDPCFRKTIREFDLTPSIRDRYCYYCPEQCSMTHFYVTPSFSNAPPEWLLSDIKEFVENTSILLPSDWSIQWRDHIRSSFLSVELLAESSLTEMYEQKATLRAVDVVSNVGGQTGLWIGISFLSLMELFEMLYRLISYQIRTYREGIIKDQKEIKAESEPPL